MAKGYIRVYRDLWDDPDWYREKFTWGQAWVDLNLMAAHDDTEFMFNGKSMKLKKGEIVTSIRKLAKRWQWTPNAVRHYITHLNHTGKAHTIPHTKCTHLMLDKYWGVGTSTTHPNNKVSNTPKAHTSTTTYKNEYINNNEKEKAAPLNPFGWELE